MSLTRKLMYVLVLALVLILAFMVIYETWQLQLISQQDIVSTEKTLFQVAAYSTMAAGDYEGKISYNELAKHGNFGIGAFDGMNGEMIALNGTFYQIPVDGIPVTVAPYATTPFAMVTFFETDQVLYLHNAMNYSELKAFIDSNLPTLDGTYAVKINGTFEYAKTRSVPIQTQPYPALTDVVANQTIFEFNSVTGTMAGYRCPSFMDGVNVAGYHCHFITDDKNAGGHILELITQDVTIEISHIQQYYAQHLP